MPTLSDAQIAGVAYKAGFRGPDLVKAVAIALGESSGRTEVTNTNTDSRRTTDYGLFQLNSYWQADKLKGIDWRDPQQNANVAYRIYVQAGNKFTDWSVYKSGRYLGYMPRATIATKNIDSTVPPSTGIPITPVVSNGGGGIGDAAKLITDPHTYLRLGMLIGGAILVLVALALTGWNNAPDSVKTVAKAVVTKKLPAGALKGAVK